MVIVSLTSTSARAHLLWHTLHSLLRQSRRADNILVNLSREPFLWDSGFDEIPEWLADLPVSVRIVENTGSYRKLLPALDLAGDDDLIVTADDDVIYGADWLSKLVERGLTEPDAVVCCRARHMRRNVFGNWRNYSDWPLIEQPARGLDILATGCAGAVYRKRLMDIEFLRDKRFLSLAPTNDDLWFKMAGMRKSTPVAVFPEIDRENAYMRHQVGLEKWNLANHRRHQSLSGWAPHLVRRLVNYLGINLTPNDQAWDLIVHYSRSSLRRTSFA